jgi:hypothetical protein
MRADCECVEEQESKLGESRKSLISMIVLDNSILFFAIQLDDQEPQNLEHQNLTHPLLSS